MVEVTEKVDNGNTKKTSKRVELKTRFERFKESLKKFKSGLTTTLVISVVIHIAMIIVGSMNIDNCSAASNVPIYLVTEGVIGIVTKVLSLSRNFLLRYFRVDQVLSTIILVEIVFFICGSVWVYKAFEPQYDPQFGLYCDRTTYLFALIFISCVYVILLGVLLVGLCACIICSCVMSKLDCTQSKNVEIEVSHATKAEEEPLSALPPANIDLR